MPNYCRNVLKCTPEVIQDIKEKYLYISISDKRTESLDFQKICPMPKELERLDAGPEHSYISVYLSYLHVTNTNKYDAVVNYINENMEDRLTKGLYLSDVVDEKPVNFSSKKVKEDIEKGKKYVDMFFKYGAFTWYDWCNNHWGTKWNSSEGNIREKESIAFTTAWNSPYGVLSRLSEKYPDETFYLYSAEEGGDSEYYEINAGWISRNRELTEEETNDVLTSY